MIELNKKHVVIISLSIGASICFFVFWLLVTILTGGTKYSTPDECFFNQPYDDVDFSQEKVRHLDLIPQRKVVVLPNPNGEDELVYIGYLRDSEVKEDEYVAYCLIEQKNGFFNYSRSRTNKAEFFESISADDFGDAFNDIDFEIVPYDSSEKDNYDPEIYNSVETEYIDSKGEKQHVIFFYTWQDTDDDPQY